MKRVAPVAEPKDFKQKAQLPGDAWLAANRDAKRPKDLWSPFLPVLSQGFAELCGYAAMHVPNGTVDHYLSFKNHPEQAYRWNNYRFASGLMNNVKRTADAKVLDPYLVGENWFEVLLPSLQLRVSDKVPHSKRQLAEDTLTRLKLRDDERLLRWRRSWYGLYQEGHLNLEGLRLRAPQIAQAVDAYLARGEQPPGKQHQSKAE